MAVKSFMAEEQQQCHVADEMTKTMKLGLEAKYTHEVIDFSWGAEGNPKYNCSQVMQSG